MYCLDAMVSMVLNNSRCICMIFSQHFIFQLALGTPIALSTQRIAGKRFVYVLVYIGNQRTLQIRFLCRAFHDSGAAWTAPAEMAFISVRNGVDSNALRAPRCVRIICILTYTLNTCLHVVVSWLCMRRSVVSLQLVGSSTLRIRDVYRSSHGAAPRWCFSARGFIRRRSSCG